MQKILELNFENTINEKLVLYTTTESLEATGLLTKVKFFYECMGTSYLLYYDFFDDLNSFKQHLQNCLEDKIVKDDSIKKNIGYYYNQYEQKNNRKNLAYKINNGHKFWVGLDALLFYSSMQFEPVTWLYSDRIVDDIIFELTPLYPWFYVDHQNTDHFEKYSDWMKTYQPILRSKINKNIIKKWIKQFENFYELIVKISRTLPCEGLLNCMGCIKTGRANS